jgi:hypothetical protein
MMTDCLLMGGSAKGDLVPSMGEWTVVASAKRGVRGPLSDAADEENDDSESELVFLITRGAGRFFSSTSLGC